MDFFSRARVVRLRSNHKKYLTADEDQTNVRQERDGSSPRARWTVHCITDDVQGPKIYLLSCYERYLTATDESVLLGLLGKRVRQTFPWAGSPVVKWYPIRRNNNRFMFQSHSGGFLWACGANRPMRSAVTHKSNVRLVFDRDYSLWEVEVLEQQEEPQNEEPPHEEPRNEELPQEEPQIKELPQEEQQNKETLHEEPLPKERLDHVRTSPSRHVRTSPSREGIVTSPRTQVRGQTIFYTVADGDGNIPENSDWRSLTFHGTSFMELKDRLREETNFVNITVFMRNAANQWFIPLFMPLYSGCSPMRFVVADSNYKAVSSLLSNAATASYSREVSSLPRSAPSLPGSAPSLHGPATSLIDLAPLSSSSVPSTISDPSLSSSVPLSSSSAPSLTISGPSLSSSVPLSSSSAPKSSASQPSLSLSDPLSSDLAPSSSDTASLPSSPSGPAPSLPGTTPSLCGTSPSSSGAAPSSSGSAAPPALAASEMHGGRTVYYAVIDNTADFENIGDWRSFIFHGTSLLDLHVRMEAERNLRNIFMLTWKSSTSFDFLPPVLPPGNQPLKILVINLDSEAVPNWFRGSVTSLPHDTYESPNATAVGGVVESSAEDNTRSVAGGNTDETAQLQGSSLLDSGESSGLSDPSPSFRLWVQ